MFRIAMVGGVALAAAGFVLSAAPAVGDGSGTVNASVTGSAACVTVNPGSVEFGTANFSRGAGPFGGPFDSNIAGTPLTIVNCSQQDEDVFVSGTDATDDSGDVWTLHDGPGMCDAGLDQYGIQINGRFLTKPSQQWQHMGGGNTSPGVVPNLIMPCTGSHGAGKKMSFQILWTASF